MTSDQPSLIDLGVRQGSIITCANAELHAAVKNGRAVAAHREKQVNENSKLLVLSQDCDIARPQNKHLELVTLKPKASPSKAIQHVRSYDKLQIPIGDQYFECESELISHVPKDLLSKVEIVVEDHVDSRILSSIIDWRIGRYQRIPFPDNFNQDFLTDYIKRPDNELGRYLETNRNFIDQLHVYVDPYDEEYADEYCVSLTALLFDGVDEAKREEIEGVIRRHAGKLHAAENRLKMIQIDEGLVPEELDVPLDFVLTPDDMTIKDASISRKINLDYLCYTDIEEE